MMFQKLLVAVALITLAACNLPASNEPVRNNTELAKPSQAVTIANDFEQTDSVEFIYFPDPSLQKQYRHLFVSDRGQLSSLLKDLGQNPGEGKECTHNSKFYLFRKGEVFKTVYVSDSCRYLAFAINSGQFFVPLSPATMQWVDSLKKAAW